MGKASFKNLTTFRVGGEIKHFFEIKNEKELVSAVNFAKKNKLPMFVIGEGSDILASDANYNRVVIKYMGNSISYIENTVTAEAGTIWDNLVKDAVKRNLQGIECMSGIPGTVGAAPIQNIGAYGQELSDVFESLRAYSIEKEKFVNFSEEDCKFGYRDSFFKTSKNWQKFIITSVTLKLSEHKDKDIELQTIRDEILRVRTEKLDNFKNVPNAGSFFKNPMLSDNKVQKLKQKYTDIKCFENEDGTYKCFAGWFIEKAGWKGKSHENAKVSDKHALVITNPEGKATSREIVELAEKIQDDVYKKFGVKLEPEVQYINT